MSVFPRPARRDPLSPDEAVRRYVEAISRDLEPDPLFRRRLRGEVVNRFVAQREGVAVAVTSPLGRQMGALGRACLYASFALALSVGGVMAASESAIPGDLLYPLKRSIEEMRMQVAPTHLRDELAAYALGERLDELSRLCEKGELAAAVALAERVEATYEELVATAGADAVANGRFNAQLAHLDDVLDQVPVRARQAIVNAMSGAPGLQAGHQGEGHADGGPGSKSQGSANDAGNEDDANGAGGNGSTNGNGPSGGAPGRADSSAPPEPTPEPTPEATPAPTPEPTPEPEASEKSERVAKPVRTPKPDVTPGATAPAEGAEGGNP
jgi:hypothetical protein